ncbi:MAG: polyphosphate kinase 1 [Bacteroidales bacterium]|nr:polyphosphate kinase 1 [Bacteroidales bacterium]
MMKFIPKEISWLSFNERVLQEAQNTENPIYDRIRFLGIYSNNLDEFYRVRVATLKRLSLLGTKANDILGYKPKATLNKINDIVLKQNYIFTLTYKQILLELKKHNIYILNENEINNEQKAFIEEYFLNQIRPYLIPIMLDEVEKLTNLEDDHVYLAVIIKTKKQKELHALLNLPTNIIPRFIAIPNKNNSQKHLMFLDDVIRANLINIFYQFLPNKIEAYTIKITRDAELDIIDNIQENYIDKILKGLQQRKSADPVRFIFDADMPPSMLKILTKKLNIDKNDTIIPGERYHNFKDLLKFPSFNLPSTNPPATIPHPLLNIKEPVIEKAQNNDILLHFPYHSFNHFIDLLREASICPLVKSISITLYRLANPSSVVNALINASKNGKDVTAFMEIQARFDEKNNINYANKLTDENVKVYLGVPGFKVHAKICLIEFHKKSNLNDIICISTGNFNGQTARTYTDLMLITSNIKLVKEGKQFFEILRNNFNKKNFLHLFVSPINMRQKIERLIKNEIKNAQNKKNAYIDIKINNLTDYKIIDLLYKAAESGVKIRLNVRAMCSITNLKHKNIEIKTIVDYYLEHSRIYIFCNDQNPKYFIGSADLMPRNLDTRFEVLSPIYDKQIQNQIKAIFECSWKDNVKARTVDFHLSNKIIKKDDEPAFRSQFEMYNVCKSFYPKNK